MRYQVLPKRNQFGLLQVRDVVDDQILDYKSKSVNKMAQFIANNQRGFELTCEAIGISVEEGMTLSSDELKYRYEESKVEEDISE